MNIVGLDHVQIAMPPGGETAARGFYGGLLGMHDVTKPEGLAGRGGCWFGGKGVAIHLGIEEPFTPQRKAHPAFRVADLEAACMLFEAAGVPVTRDNSVPHVRRFYVSDPFGNRLEFIQEGDAF